MFRKFILVALLCLNSYKTLAEDKKAESVPTKILINISEKYNCSDSDLVEKRKQHIKEKKLKPIYSEHFKQGSGYLISNKEISLFQFDSERSKEILSENPSIKMQKKLLEDMQLRHLNPNIIRNQENFLQNNRNDISSFNYLIGKPNYMN
ncbi:MAG TPA: hypothetical protein LFV66_01120 [Rickettsia endosymbiont of Bembidion lapponicum]|nr:hypothetical protein [Rickettsia endosymbiont of Bembidion lapponicum]